MHLRYVLFYGCLGSLSFFMKTRYDWMSRKNQPESRLGRSSSMAQNRFPRATSRYFSLGRIAVDQRSAKKLSSEDVIPALGRHISGDWGKVSKVRHNANQIALRTHRPLHSVYFSMDGVKFHVITNADRSQTSITAL